jgi:hypothetical protein
MKTDKANKHTLWFFIRPLLGERIDDPVRTFARGYLGMPFLSTQGLSTRFINNTQGLSVPKQDFPATVVALTKAKNLRWLRSRAVNLS